MINNIKFIQGNEACVEGALYAGLDFFAGYPITPSTEIAEMMSIRLPQIGGKFLQMEDEIASMCAIIGASLTGHKVLTATSGPGFSLKQEALGYAIMAEIPCVIVNVQRGGPSTGNPTHVSQGDVNQSRWGTHGDHAIIVLTASNHQDVFAITVEAFNMAETYRTPVILLFDEVVGHMRERLVIPEKGDIPLVQRLKTAIKRDVDYHPYLPREDGRLPMSDFGEDHRYNVTGLFHDMWGFPTDNPQVVHGLLRHLVDKINNNVHQIARLKEYFLEDATTILISYGSSARSALHLAKERRTRGERLGLIELQTLWPFPYGIIRQKCENARFIVVVEMNMGQMLHEIKLAVNNPEKVFLANRIDGELITPDDIKKIIRLIQGKGV
ncbi:MAG: 2-oxoacid:acceptor oxidoreductase subunit alpha [Deltaproteobacteria bacterium]|nr:2-oxoacid:acceptor oxidoreductase subunit alpha [Deltaproteobacteria bacterium]